MSTIHCPECGTENEEQYLYCKNCGTPLKSAPTKSSADFNSKPIAEQPPVNQTAYTAPNTAAGNGTYSDGGMHESYIGNIPESDFRLFIGKNADKFLPKFAKMEFTGSKVSWVWPPVILSFFLGPLGGALWFFYRKMYKPALILAAIGVAISIITGTVSAYFGTDYLNDFWNSLTSGNFYSAMDAFNSPGGIANSLISTLSDAIDLATCAVTGIFGNFLYKKHCCEKISSFKTQHSDPQLYKLGLTYLGGTSGGMLALGICVIVGAEYLVSALTLLLSFIS